MNAAPSCHRHVWTHLKTTQPWQHETSCYTFKIKGTKTTWLWSWNPPVSRGADTRRTEPWANKLTVASFSQAAAVVSQSYLWILSKLSKLRHHFTIDQSLRNVRMSRLKTKVVASCKKRGNPLAPLLPSSRTYNVIRWKIFIVRGEAGEGGWGGDWRLRQGDEWLTMTQVRGSGETEDPGDAGWWQRGAGGPRVSRWRVITDVTRSKSLLTLEIWVLALWEHVTRLVAWVQEVSAFNLELVSSVRCRCVQKATPQKHTETVKM